MAVAAERESEAKRRKVERREGENDGDDDDSYYSDQLDLFEIQVEELLREVGTKSEDSQRTLQFVRRQLEKLYECMREDEGKTKQKPLGDCDLFSEIGTQQEKQKLDGPNVSIVPGPPEALDVVGSWSSGLQEPVSKVVCYLSFFFFFHDSDFDSESLTELLGGAATGAVGEDEDVQEFKVSF